MSTGSTVPESGRIAAREARIHLAEILNRVAYRGERIVLHRRGKDAAALVPVEDLRLLEQIEDRIDADDARKVLSEMEAKGEEPVPYEQVRRELGLDAGAAHVRRGRRTG
jgi:prevent-host-death family protein